MPAHKTLRARLAVSAIATLALAASSAYGQYSFTLVHTNDMESLLFPNVNGNAAPVTVSGSTYNVGGAAGFVATVKKLQNAAVSSGSDLITLSGGDGFLPGLALNASLTKTPSVPWYDSLVHRRVGYQAMTLGNHEFDIGPAGLKDFAAGMTAPLPSGVNLSDFPTLNSPFLTQIDLSTNPAYAASPNSFSGKYARSTILTTASGEKIGVVGVTTPLLPTISSPGPVTFPYGNDLTLNAVAQAANDEALALTNLGVNKIILSGHLQSIRNDVSIIPLLKNIDIVMSAGGHELMTNPNTTAFPYIPNDAPNATLASGTALTYGQLFKDSDNKNVALVTANAIYRYVGNLVANFDANGELTGVDTAKSGAVRVLSRTSTPAGGLAPQTVIADQPTIDAVETPIKAYIDTQNAAVIGSSSFQLDTRRSAVRTRETNFGNLTADALVWQARQLWQTQSGPIIGLQNGGGIRSDALFAAGNVTLGRINSALPFLNITSYIENVSSTDILAMLENSVANIVNVDGRFGQYSGIKYLYDPSRPVGSRVYEIYIDLDNNGTLDPYYLYGNFVSTTPVDIATIDFLARGGDSYAMLAKYTLNTVGVNYQEAVSNYIQQSLGGVINDPRYALNVNQRVFAVPEPSAAFTLLTPAALLLSRRRR